MNQGLCPHSSLLQPSHRFDSAASAQTCVKPVYRVFDGQLLQFSYSVCVQFSATCASYTSAGVWKLPQGTITRALMICPNLCNPKCSLFVQSSAAYPLFKQNEFSDKCTREKAVSAGHGEFVATEFVAIAHVGCAPIFLQQPAA